MEVTVRERRGGQEVLIGLVVIVVLTRLWLGDSFDAILRSLIQDLRGEEGLSSSSFALATIASQVMYGAGVVAVSSWSGLWSLVQRIVGGWFASKTDDDILRAIDANLQTLQDQIDRMKAETTWAAARKAGADDGEG